MLSSIRSRESAVTWVCEPVVPEQLTAVGQLFRMVMYQRNHPDGNYQMVSQVQAFGPPPMDGGATYYFCPSWAESEHRERRTDGRNSQATRSHSLSTFMLARSARCRRGAGFAGYRRHGRSSGCDTYSGGPDAQRLGGD